MISYDDRLGGEFHYRFGDKGPQIRNRLNVYKAYCLFISTITMFNTLIISLDDN